MAESFISSQSFTTPEYLSPSAWLEHIPFAFELVSRLKPSVFVELGVHYGASYFAICQAIKANDIACSCFGIDSWQGDEHTGFYDEKLFTTVSDHNNRHFADFSKLIKLTFDEGSSNFDDKSIDLLHIDGLHTYEAVKKDFDTWLPKLSDSSVVLFHDIAMKEMGFGVFKLWEELSLLYPNFSFEHSWGLGILATGKRIAPELAPLFSYDEPAIKNLRWSYQKLGSTISDKFALKLNAEYQVQMTAEMRNRTIALETLKGEREQLNIDLITSETAVESLKQQLVEKEQAVTALEVEAQSLRNLCLAKDSALAIGNGQIKQLRDTIDEQIIELSDSQLLNEKLTLEFSLLKKEIRSFIDSNSWKLTYPLRKLKYAIDGFFGKNTPENEEN